MKKRTIILKKLARLGLFLALLAANNQLAAAAPGYPDLTFAGFGEGGKVITTGVPMSGFDYRGMALQPDGKLVVAGQTGSGLLVMRYLSNGDLDTAFDGDGIVTISWSDPVGASDVAIQADGKIVVAGFSNGSTKDFMLARLTSAGALDSSFGGGFVTTDFDNDDDSAAGLLIQPNGKIVACGTAHDGGDEDFGVARYNADGSLDTTFGNQGKITVGFGDSDYCNDLALLEDGDLVLAGDHLDPTFPFEWDFAVARLNADGTLDTSFDVDGKLTTGFGGDDLANAIAIQPDGKIVAAGDDLFGDHVRVARYLPDGVLDDTFDGDGKLSIDTPNVNIRDLAIQQDGKLVLLGYQFSDFVFYRLNPDSSLDSTFHGDGRLYLDIAGAEDSGYALALQADGRIVAYGANGSDHALVRLWPDGSLDQGSRQALDFVDAFFDPNSSETAYGLALQPDGKMVVAGDIANAGATDRNFALARFLPDGQLDATFGALGQVSFGFGGLEVATAVALQDDGKIVAAGSQGSGDSANFMVARFSPTGTPDNTFGFAGFTALDFLGEDDYGTSVALAPDGKILVAGTSTSAGKTYVSVARLNSNGTADNTFSLDGKVIFQSAHFVSQTANALVVQDDLKIVVAGNQTLSNNSNFALVRFNANGTLDTAFGSGGSTITDMGGSDNILALASTPDGEIVAAGFTSYAGDSDFALASYTANGLLDTTFGVGGKTTIDFGSSDAALDVAVRGDGIIAVAGHAGALIAVAQLLPDGNLDPAFYSTGQATVNFVGDEEWAWAVCFVAPNKMVLAGYQTVNGNRNMALARFETTAEPGPVPDNFQIFLPIAVR